jgi:phage shock protein C
MVDAFRSLRRSRTDRKIAGVIGGLAQHFDLGSTPLRIAYVLVSILSAAFPGIFVYLLLWVLIPEAEQRPGRTT